MKLVVDANILFSFFRENPVRLIILNSKYFNLELFSPAYVFGELKSNIPDLIKKSHVRNLINIGYIEKKYVRPIAQGYLLTANMMRADEDLKKEGLNKKLADELNNFVKKTYPDIYQEFVKTATLSAELSSGK